MKTFNPVQMDQIDTLSELHITASETLFQIKLRIETIRVLKKVANNFSQQGIPLADNHFDQLETLIEEVEKKKIHYLLQLKNMSNKVEEVDV